MRTTEQLSVTLPKEMARMIRGKVASGEYASESEVIRDGLRALQARDRALETWLRTDVVAAYDEARANPSALLRSAEVRARLAAHHKRSTKKRS
jgi:antitoxin ParD1/3/4